MYWAGGFQGGKTKPWIKAMKAMRKLIDADLSKSYIPIWNDESAWNKYLSENPPSVMLNPSYVYPDSLIKEYYEPKVWGQSFLPKIITITKQFTTSKEGGEAVAKMIS
jgi:histo-blood group ABO system transferase